jgi:hypothetical protein
VSDDDIARGAAKLHEREVAAANQLRDAREAADIEAARAGERELAKRREVFKRTLGPPMKDRWIFVIATLGLVATGAVVVNTPKNHAFTMIMISSIGYMAVVLTLPFLIPSVIAKVRAAGLERIGYGVDLSRYRLLLSQQRKQERVVLTCTFATPVAEDKRAQLADALRGWVPELETAVWDGDALKATSAELAGTIYLTGRYGGGRQFSNQAAHAVVMKTLEQLPKLGVTALDIQFDGKLETSDEHA